MKGVKRFFGAETEEEKSLADEFDQQCSLSYRSRMIGFGFCFAIGWIVTFLALLSIRDVRSPPRRAAPPAPACPRALPLTRVRAQISTKPERFALLYTAGNVISILSTLFLWGPVKQIKTMFERKRVLATSLYLFAIVLTLVMAFAVKKVGAVLAAMVLQFFAMASPRPPPRPPRPPARTDSRRAALVRAHVYPGRREDGQAAVRLLSARRAPAPS
jgi:hypothetical protein